MLKIAFLISGLLLAELLDAQSAKTKTIIEDRRHFSKLFNQMRDCRFFLPPDYYSNPSKRYPVIYYFHGFCGRFNGPLVPVNGVFYEARYYDEFNGDYARCGFDSLDNIAEFVKNNDVIVAKWDGYVPEHYPRPYDMAGEYIDAIIKKKSPEVNMQFINYFPEFMNYVDSSFRTIASREGRAVTGLSMGGFMSLFVSSKYPHLISSASFFCPSVGFIIGPSAQKIYTPFSEMAMNYSGLPIRMHIGSKDFLRQHNLILDKTFKTLELNYESWQYGTTYSNGNHEMYDINGQFGFHMKYFRLAFPKPVKWYHNDIYPGFEVWNYTFKSDRKTPGFTIVEDARREGFKLTGRRWMPGGTVMPEVNFNIQTDTLYTPNSDYNVIVLDQISKKITASKIKSDNEGKISLKVNGGGSDVGIFADGDPGHISMPDFTLNVKMPKAWQKIKFSPVLFNKGGATTDSIKIDLMSLDQEVEVMTGAQTIDGLKPGAIHQNASFELRSRNEKLDRAKLKLVVQYGFVKDQFIVEIPFYNPESRLTHFEISDGKSYQRELETEFVLGEGNKNGVANPGEWISIVTKTDPKNKWWLALELMTDDPYVNLQKSRMQYDFYNDGSGAMKPASEIFIKPGCPVGHIIKFYGTYQYQKPGYHERDGENSATNLHETRRVSFEVKVGGK